MPELKEIMHRYFQGLASSQETEIIYNWIKENPENKKMFFSEKDLWDASLLHSEQLNNIEYSSWMRLQKKTLRANALNFQMKHFFRSAAVIVLAVAAGWFGNILFTAGMFENNSVGIKHVESINGQIKEVFLADGTHVWLNSGSRLSFPSNFTHDKREVELSGEAYFEVNANEKEPFLVTTGNHTILVTGTRFNVCEYPESNRIETTLEEGKVKLITGNFIKDLYPGQQASFNTETAEIRIGEADINVYTSWKDGRYDFNDEPVSKIFKIIERWWDVQIDYPVEELKNEKITGTLRRHKPLEQHFDVIKQLVPFKYSKDSDVIKITRE